MARILSKHAEEFVTPDRMSPSSSSSKPVRTVVSALDPVLPCTQLKPFFLSVLALLRDSPVSLWNSARFTAPGSKPPRRADVAHVRQGLVYNLLQAAVLVAFHIDLPPYRWRIGNNQSRSGARERRPLCGDRKRLI